MKPKQTIEREIFQVEKTHSEVPYQARAGKSYRAVVQTFLLGLKGWGISLEKVLGG